MNARLQEIADEISALPAALQQELFVEMSNELAPLPARYEAARDAGLGRVHECQTPVFFFPEVEGGRVRLYADVPRNAPTQRALVGLLIDAYDGATPEEVAAIPDDLLRRLGVTPWLSMTRQRGFAGVLARLKRGVAAAAGP